MPPLSIRRCFSIAIPLAFSRSIRAARVTIGVFTLFHSTSLSFAPALGESLIVRGGSRSFQLESGQAARCRAVEGAVECRAGERRLRARKIRATARGGRDARLVLAIPRKIVRRYQGALTLVAIGANLVPVVSMDLEVAVASAVAAESPPRAPLAALEAQAVVARSYFLAAPHRSRPFEFSDTTQSQFLRSPPPARSLAARAVRATRGLVVLYHGAPIAALYSASCGGRTRTLREDGLRADGYPYFSVRCPPCAKRARRWTARLTLRQAAPLLAHPGWEAPRLAINRKYGWEFIRSDNYTLKIENGEVVISGRGQGHGVGLCEVGAAALAREGWSFERILRYYFPNTSIGVEPRRAISNGGKRWPTRWGAVRYGRSSNARMCFGRTRLKSRRSVVTRVARLRRSATATSDASTRPRKSYCLSSSAHR